MERKHGKQAASHAVDLTRGPILKGIVLFALPLLGSGVMQQLYGSVDLLFVGNVLGTGASAALGVSSMLISCLVGFFSGISVGVNVAVAKALGAEDGRAASRATHCAVALGVVGGLALAVLGWALAPWYLSQVQAPPEIVDDALLYLRVYFVSMLAVVMYNMCAGIVRSLGDSATPLRAQFMGCLVNVAMNAAFLLIGWGIAGIAAATLFSQGVAAWILVRYLRRVDGPCRLHLRKVALHADVVKPVLAVGVPTGLESMVITLSNVFVQYQINLLGTVPIAAFTAYFRIELPLYYAIVALGQAATTFVAQNCGAGLYSRARKGTNVCLGLGIAVTAALACLLLFVGHWAFWIFNQDPAVIETGLQIISVTFPFYWLYVFIEILAGACRGRGQAIVPMVVILLNVCVLRVAFLFWVCSVAPSVPGVASAYPVSWALTALGMLVCHRAVVRKLDKDTRKD